MPTSPQDRGGTSIEARAQEAYDEVVARRGGEEALRQGMLCYATVDGIN